MELKKKSAVYSLQEENEDFILTGDLTLDADNLPAFNGSISSKSNAGKGFTCYYQKDASGNVSFSASGCPFCEQAAHKFINESIDAAVAQANGNTDTTTPHADAQNQAEPTSVETGTPETTTTPDNTDTTATTTEGGGE